MYARKIVKGTSPNEDKIIAIFEKLDDENNRVRIFYGDKDKIFLVSNDKFKSMKSKPRTCQYILIKFSKQTFKTLREQYETIQKEATLLKELTKGKVNIFRTGSTAKTALQLFYDLRIDFTEPEEIDEQESEILESCSRGALIYGIPYKGKGYKYDVCSEYPSIMISKALKIPFGKPTFETITNEEFTKLKFFKYGIYHVEVIDPDFRVFRNNDSNWYTHTDLNYAMNVLKYKLELIQDGESNAMIYNTNLKSIRCIFKPFIDFLFEHKKNGVKEVKKYINALWGALCQKNEITVKADEIFDDKVLHMIKPNFKELKEDNDMSHHIAIVYTKEKRYETNFARIEPFIVASGRLKISNIILPNIDNIVRCHTDGIILKKPIQHVELGDDIGELKFEGEGQCHILCSNDFKFGKEIHGNKSKFEEKCLFK